MKLYSVKEFLEKTGISYSTLRRYIKNGIVHPIKTPTGRYKFTEQNIKEVIGYKNPEKQISEKPKCAIYCRVSASKQKNYLKNQIELCKKFAIERGYEIVDIYTDIASSFNFKRKGLKKLFHDVFSDFIAPPPFEKLIIYSKDRLSRIAYELIEQVFKYRGIDIIVIDNSDTLHDDEQLKDYTEELISFIHYITSKIYGSRAYKSKKIKECIEKHISIGENEDE